MQRTAPWFAAVGLLLVGLLHNNAHKWVSAAAAGRVYLITGTLLALVGVVAYGLWWHSRWVWLSVALVAGYLLQALVANAWYLWRPWHITPGARELASDGLHFPLGLAGLWLATMLVQYLSLRGTGDGRT